MESIIERLNNTISFSKQSIPITITGRITNKDGTFIERLEQPIRLDDTVNYHVYLQDFAGWSNVPNVTGSNNMFYIMYKKSEFIKPLAIKFPVSTQSVDTYNDFLEAVFIKNHAYYEDPNDQTKKIFPVKFTYDLTVMRVIMHIHPGCTVDFRENTWYQELGFEKGIYEHDPKKPLIMAPNIADIVKSLNILIKTNLSFDWIFRGKRTNIIYNILNNVPAGQMLTERPNPVKRVVLSNKNIEEIVLQFVTEDGMAVDFNGEEIILTLVIERMYDFFHLCTL